MTSQIFSFSPETIDTTKKGSWGLLIRHAEREELTVNNVASAQLTDNGRKSARLLGAALKGKRTYQFLSSHIERCVDTNRCILEGLGFSPEEAKKKAEPCHTLAHAYMTEPESAKRVFFLRDPYQLILDYLGGEEVPGFGTIERGANVMLDLMEENMQAHALSCFVTHDALIMPFKQHFLGEDYSNDNWLPFLSGCLVYIEGNDVLIDGIPVERKAGLGNS